MPYPNPSPYQTADAVRYPLYRMLAANLPDAAVFLLEKDMRITIAEGQGLRRNNYNPQALEGQRITDVLSDTQSSRDLLNQYREGLEGREDVREYQWPQGYFRVHTLPVRNENGEVTRLMVVAIDITRQKEDQRKLEAASERTHAIMEALPDVMLVVNREGIISQVFGRDDKLSLFPAHIHNVHIRDVDTNPTIRQKSLKALEDAFRTGNLQTYTYDITHNEATYSFETRTMKVSDDEAIMLIRDVSVSNRAMQHLAQALADLENLRAFDQAVNQQLSVAYVIEQAMKYTLRIATAQRGIMALVEDDALRVAAWAGECDEATAQAFVARHPLLLQQMMQNTAPYALDTETKPSIALLAPGGSLACLPIRMGSRPLGVIVLELDAPRVFTTRMLESLERMGSRIATGLENARLYDQTEQQLVQMQALYQQVQKLEQLKTDMIRLASHDLKNPLAGIKGYLELLKLDMGGENPAYKAYLDEIGRAAARMEMIANGILSLDRISQMADNTLREEVDLVQLVQQVVQEYQGMATRSSQQLVWQPAAASAYVCGDAIQLQEAVNNLLNNAVKYTPHGGVIRVELATENNRALFQVVDTGYGVPETLQQRLFTPFSRARTQETATVEGTGLGLALVKSIVERHQGTLIFKSVYRQGSTFGFSLPLAGSS
jgi:signal transduction histidine kinase/PAS domain-containing protein